MVRLIVALGIAAGLVGCASQQPKILTRCHPNHSPSGTNSIALAARAQPSQLEAALDEALRTELTRRGFTLTNATAADFVLASWVEENWSTVKSAGGFGAPVGNMTFDGSPVTSPGSLTVGMSADGQMERYLASESLRLELFPRPASGRPNLTPVWTGSIEGGNRVTVKEVPSLLQALLDHFGRDFSGRARPDR